MDFEEIMTLLPSRRWGVLVLTPDPKNPHPMFDDALLREGLERAGIRAVPGQYAHLGQVWYGFSFPEGRLFVCPTRPVNEWYIDSPGTNGEHLRWEHHRTPFDVPLALEAISRSCFGVSLPETVFGTDKTLARHLRSGVFEKDHLESTLDGASPSSSRLRL